MGERERENGAANGLSGARERERKRRERRDERSCYHRDQIFNMKLPFFGRGKPATISTNKNERSVGEGLEGDGNRKVNIVDIGKVEDEGKETLTGYCSLSENLEPCEWTFSKPKDTKKKPLLRILF